MPRIVAGVAGGRRLVSPAGSATRPTADRVRGALFASLGDRLAGARVLDLFAGGGAVGLEALSRGAEQSLLVESGPAALRALRANVAALALPGAVVVAGTVERTLGLAPAARPGTAGPVDVVYVDPPYRRPVRDVLEQLVAHAWLAPQAVVVVERASRDPALGWPAGLRGERSRRYGDSTLWYGRAS